MSLRPHKKFNFVGMWKYGFILSGCLVALALIGLIASFVVTGSPLTLGTEFSGGTSIQISDTGDITEDQITNAFKQASSELGIDTQISSVQTSTDAAGNAGFIVKTTDTVSTNASKIMANVESQLNIDQANVQVETIGASWGASVIWASFIAFLLSCVAILIVISLRYREPRMGVVALITLFHDLIIIVGIYAWAGMFFHMEITSDVIAALLAIIGYSLYDTIVVFHRINKNASPQMKCSLRTCANRSVNEIIVRSLNTSITSALPVLVMLILGTDTLLSFAFALFCGMIIGVYSTLAISAPVYTLWKSRDPQYARLEKKYPYEVVQSTFTKEMLLQAREDSKEARKKEREEAAAKAKAAAEQKAAEAEAAKEAKEAEAAAEEAASDAVDAAEEAADGAADELAEVSEDTTAALDDVAETADEAVADEAAVEEAAAEEAVAEEATEVSDEPQAVEEAEAASEDVAEEPEA